MLTRTAAAVKFDLPSTPEQKACSMHLGEGLKTFWSLVEHLQHAADEHQPIHQVEEIIFRELLVVGRWLLQAFLDLAGPGDVGPTLTVAGDSASDQDQELPRLDRPRKRPYLSIFGEIAIERICYGHDRVEAAPLDAQLHLPRRQYSYLLQQWLGAFVVDDAHAEAIRGTERARLTHPERAKLTHPRFENGRSGQERQLGFHSDFRLFLDFIDSRKR